MTPDEIERELRWLWKEYKALNPRVLTYYDRLVAIMKTLDMPEPPKMQIETKKRESVK